MTGIKDSTPSVNSPFADNPPATSFVLSAQVIYSVSHQVNDNESFPGFGRGTGHRCLAYIEML
jgi:hypothetical protein